MDRPWKKHIPSGNPLEIEIPEMSLTDLFYESVEKYADKTAVTFNEDRYTYSQLGQLVKRFARLLAAAGIEKGDRVALMLSNCPQYPIGFFAALLNGAIVVQINPMYKSNELIHVLKDSGARHIIVLDDLLPVVEAVWAETNLEKMWIVSKDKDKCEMMKDLLSGAEFDYSIPIDPGEDVAVLQYTGGTTGRSKGAMLTHRNIVANTLQSAATTRINTEKGKERVLGVSPLFHVYGMTSGMNVTFYNGGELIIVSRFEVSEIVDMIQNLKPTIFPGVPTMYIALLHYYQSRPFDLHSLKSCVSGSSPLPLHVLSRFNEVSGTKVAEGYGLSEASPVTHRNPVNGLQKPGSIGIPIQNTDAAIIDSVTGKPSLLVNIPGELVIKGPQVMKGYWGMPEETKKTIQNGWLHTGDIARMDEDGFFYIVGRKKEMIIAGGFNIYPIEIEDILYSHPKVLEAAVFGVPDQYRGETVHAAVVLKPNETITEQELEEYCRKQLAAFKVPKVITVESELPKTAVGKILKRKLQEKHIAYLDKV
ncbi:long-chain fatty acid--CoA ligase [Peribacillus muralis]|uniref:long-chain-fatty-acid--CoA ligase n=1 Tax=Peribacillus muralis TaxID=264697 RepID=UPI001F4EB1F0|nr:long-chain fatty acid--CoA ligase [Peribacillus muralis]MCK1993646.1 long-chain fatty acid--CoA ligase [Peribacillus muralis]MCK2014066.1 long-chain fatty acid--CoA ligase [Peribacillus muralis]